MRRWKKVLLWTLGVLLVICIALTVAIVQFVHSLHPTWVERYSVEGNKLVVVDSSGKPVPGALVIRIAAVGRKSGGWDIHSVMIPKKGETSRYVALDEPSVWSSHGDFTDASGTVVVEPFDAHCEAERGLLGVSQNEGFFAVVAYKRGVGVALLRPGVEVPAPPTLKLELFYVPPEATHPDHLTDRAIFRSLTELLSPPLRDGNPNLNGELYLSTKLSDGRTLGAFGKEEASWISSNAQTADFRLAARALSREIDQNDVRAISISP